MQSTLAVTVTCDSLVEFEEDAAKFAEGAPEYVGLSLSEGAAAQFLSEPCGPLDPESTAEAEANSARVRAIAAA